MSRYCFPDDPDALPLPKVEPDPDMLGPVPNYQHRPVTLAELDASICGKSQNILAPASDLC